MQAGGSLPRMGRMSLPLQRLHSLDLLRGFVAVGRRMSMTQAADDLCLTQSAISKQIRALEEMVGSKLFRRSHRAIAFTPAGERLFRSADIALQQLQDTMGLLMEGRLQRPVTVTASIGVAGLWLLPRLGSFQKKHPQIDVRVAANNALLDLRNENVDLAIRYCRESAAPRGSERLFGDTVAPVASPRLGLRSLSSARAVAAQYLLEYDDVRRPWLLWKTWLDALGLEGAQPKGVLRFNQYDQMIHAAVAGQGIALGRMELLAPLVAEGKLVELTGPKARPASEFAHWLILAEPQPRPEVQTVAQWLRAEAAG
jgi:LysR family transcriptional regulator, glycine cleavage system transcriptional activator